MVLSYVFYIFKDKIHIFSIGLWIFYNMHLVDIIYFNLKLIVASQDKWVGIGKVKYVLENVKIINHQNWVVVFEMGNYCCHK